jgi:hypothetical protein
MPALPANCAGGSTYCTGGLLYVGTMHAMVVFVRYDATLNIECVINVGGTVSAYTQLNS